MASGISLSEPSEACSDEFGRHIQKKIINPTKAYLHAALTQELQALPSSPIQHNDKCLLIREEGGHIRYLRCWELSKSTKGSEKAKNLKLCKNILSINLHKKENKQTLPSPISLPVHIKQIQE